MGTRLPSLRAGEAFAAILDSIGCCCLLIQLLAEQFGVSLPTEALRISNKQEADSCTCEKHWGNREAGADFVTFWRLFSGCNKQQAGS